MRPFVCYRPPSNNTDVLALPLAFNSLKLNVPIDARGQGSIVEK
jgi:hypothetical protein